MPVVTISEIWLHSVDKSAGTATPLSFENNTDVVDFVTKVVEKISATKSTKEFYFPRESAEARTLLLLMCKGKGDAKNAALLMAQKLARIEKAAQERYGHLNGIQAGHLLQVIFEKEGITYALVAKVDFMKILEKTSLHYSEGLPIERYMMKASLTQIEKNCIKRVLVSDSNSSIAAYWSDDFLDLEALRTDTSNTTTAFSSIEKTLTTIVKSRSVSDFRRMRSGVLGYLKNKPTIIYDDLIETVFGTYEADNPEVDLTKLKEKLLKLPTEFDFDTHFSSDPKAIAKKRVVTISLTTHLDLTVKDDDAVSGTVKPFMDAGRKALKIYTEAGYDYFSGQTSNHGT